MSRLSYSQVELADTCNLRRLAAYQARCGRGIEGCENMSHSELVQAMVNHGLADEGSSEVRMLIKLGYLDRDDVATGGFCVQF